MQNKTNNSTNLPLWQDPKAEKSPPDTSSYEQSLAKIRVKMAKREIILRKSLSRAHYAIGLIVMGDPEMRKLLAPLLERHLAKMGGARKAVEDYDRTAAEIAKLKALRG